MNNQYYFCMFYLSLCCALNVPCLRFRVLNFVDFFAKMYGIEVATCYTQAMLLLTNDQPRKITM